MTERLTQRDGATLLRLARAAVVDAVCGGSRVDDLLARLEIDPALEVPRAAFVTLRSAPAGPGPAELRGCIGSMAARLPLYRNVIHIAPRSALEDPRFPPVTEGELAGLSIEVSALSPPRPIASIDEIAVGEHGVELSHLGRHAVFLPQVGAERGWTTEALLRHLAAKAGLDPGNWRDAELSVFHAEIFDETAPEARRRGGP